jgi:DNA primase
VWIDLKAAKQSVSMEQLLAHYSVSLRKVNSTSLRGQCPLPTHSSKETKYSFSVNTEKSIWTCKSDSCVKGSGKKGGNILDFVAVMESVAVIDAAKKILEWFPTNGNSPKPEASKPEPAKAENTPLGFELKGIAYHPYLESRGITKETAETFGVGFFPGKGSMAGRVVIPIHNETGELIAYAGRAIDNTEPKYRFPPGFSKSHALFNLNRVLKLPAPRRVIVVEGFFDAMKVHQAGFPAVVALMGCTLSDVQAALLVTHCEAATLMLDGDETGQEATTRISAQLIHNIYVKVAPLSGGNQPDQLSSEEIKTLLG